MRILSFHAAKKKNCKYSHIDIMPMLKGIMGDMQPKKEKIITNKPRVLHNIDAAHEWREIMY